MSLMEHGRPIQMFEGTDENMHAVASYDSNERLLPSKRDKWYEDFEMLVSSWFDMHALLFGFDHESYRG